MCFHNMLNVFQFFHGVDNEKLVTARIYWSMQLQKNITEINNVI